MRIQINSVADLQEVLSDLPEDYELSFQIKNVLKVSVGAVDIDDAERRIVFVSSAEEKAKAETRRKEAHNLTSHDGA